MKSKLSIYFLALSLGSVCFFSSLHAYADDSGRRERYRSSSDNNLERYGTKDRSERQKFDKNLGKYQNLSPSQKRQKIEKWREFKENTTPEEREYIRKKMRRESRRNGGR